IGPGDKFIAQTVQDSRTPAVAVVTKADTVSPGRLAEHLIAVDQLGDWADIIPVSATSGYQLEELVSVLRSHMPVSPPLYPASELKIGRASCRERGEGRAVRGG